MPRTARAAVVSAKFWYLHSRAGLHVVAIELGGARQKQEVTAGSNERGGIGIERARIGVEVFVSAELQWIDKNTHDDKVMFAACARNEG